MQWHSSSFCTSFLIGLEIARRVKKKFEDLSCILAKLVFLLTFRQLRCQSKYFSKWPLEMRHTQIGMLIISIYPSLWILNDDVKYVWGVHTCTPWYFLQIVQAHLELVFVLFFLDRFWIFDEVLIHISVALALMTLDKLLCRYESETHRTTNFKTLVYQGLVYST